MLVDTLVIISLPREWAKDEAFENASVTLVFSLSARAISLPPGKHGAFGFHVSAMDKQTRQVAHVYGRRQRGGSTQRNKKKKKKKKIRSQGGGCLIYRAVAFRTPRGGAGSAGLRYVAFQF